MKKTLLAAAALFATIAASAQTIVWPSTVSRETKEANVKATVTGSETITATDITMGADIKIGDKDGVNAVTAVKDATGANLQFPSETDGIISWRPINGNVDGAEATADLAEGAGAYIDFTIEESDINKDLSGLSSFEFDVTKVGTDAIRINAKLIGEGDTNVDTGWLINGENAYTFGDEYNSTEQGNKACPWDEAANGYNPSRNDGSKGVDGGANANGISHVKIAVPAEFLASNPYKVTLRIAIIKCANNKDLGVNAVTFNIGGGDTPAGDEVDLTLTEGHTLLVSDIEAAGGTDADIIRFTIKNGSGESREGWGIGGFANSDNWTPSVEWTGAAGDTWTYEYTVAQIKATAGDSPGEYHGIGITINIYNGCTVDKVTLVKAGSTGIQSAKTQAKAGIRYNLAGQKVDANYKGIVIENGKKFMVK